MMAEFPQIAVPAAKSSEMRGVKPHQRPRKNVTEKPIKMARTIKKSEPSPKSCNCATDRRSAKSTMPARRNQRALKVAADLSRPLVENRPNPMPARTAKRETGNPSTRASRTKRQPAIRNKTLKALTWACRATAGNDHFAPTLKGSETPIRLTRPEGSTNSSHAASAWYS